MSIGSSRSRSSSKSSSFANETGQQVEDQGNAFNFSGIVSGKKNQATININTTDFGSVIGALNLADDALDIADSSTSNALEFSAGAFSKALESSDESRAQALEFSAGAFSSALDAVNQSSAAALASSDQSRRDAIEFSAGAFSAALDSVDDAAELAVSTAASAFNSSTGQISRFAKDAIDKISESAKSEASAGFQLLLKLVAGVAVAGVALYAVGRT